MTALDFIAGCAFVVAVCNAIHLMYVIQRDRDKTLRARAYEASIRRSKE